MGRRSSGGRATPRAAPVRNPPQPAKAAPPPAPAQGEGSIVGRIGSAIADGMSFGTGSAIAHRAVDAILGPRVIQHETVSSSTPAAAASAAPGSSDSMGLDACNLHSKAFQDCINSNGSDISKCQFYLDMLNECRGGGSGEMLRA